MMEIWVDVIGYDGLYEVSNLGNVKSCDGVFKNQYTSWPKKGKLLKPRVHTGGYLRVNLWDNGRVTDKYIHRLVADAFLPFDPDRPYINHKDGNKTNNVVSNLERVTHQENIDHAMRTGLVKSHLNQGGTNPMAKLDVMQVKTIRSLYKDGIKAKQLGLYFGVHPSTIYPIVNNKCWILP